MAAAKIGEKVPLAVVGKDGTKVGDDGQENMMTNEERQTAIQQLSEQLKALREQVETLSGSLAKMGNKAGRAVAHSAGAATDTVTTTVRTYPFYAVLAASAAAFVLGRLSVASTQSAPDRAYDQLRHRLRDLASHLPPNLVDSFRSSIR
jgi:sorbitol-specific phosphotransferase system component IIBC